MQSQLTACPWNVIYATSRTRRHKNKTSYGLQVYDISASLCPALAVQSVMGPVKAYSYKNWGSTHFKSDLYKTRWIDKQLQNLRWGKVIFISFIYIKDQLFRPNIHHCRCMKGCPGRLKSQPNRPWPKHSHTHTAAHITYYTTDTETERERKKNAPEYLAELARINLRPFWSSTLFFWWQNLSYPHPKEKTAWNLEFSPFGCPPQPWPISPGLQD